MSCADRGVNNADSENNIVLQNSNENTNANSEAYDYGMIVLTCLDFKAFTND